jgi:hypothetical protein
MLPEDDVAGERWPADDAAGVCPEAARHAHIDADDGESAQCDP